MNTLQNLSIDNDMLNWSTDAFRQFEMDNSTSDTEYSINDFPSIDDESFSGERPWGYLKECHEYFANRS